MINPSFGIRTISGVDFARKATGANWWEVSGKTCVGAWQAKGAASQAASYTNLANPGTYNLTEGVAPTWDSTNGWIFNGTTQYLATGYAIGTSAIHTLIARFSGGDITTAGVSRVVSGSRLAGENRFYVAHYDSSQTGPIWGGGGYLVTGAGGYANGVMCIAARDGYYNGSYIGTTNNPYAGGDNNLDIWIGGVHTVGTGPYKGNIQAVAIYSDTLTAGQVATLSAAMAAL